MTPDQRTPTTQQVRSKYATVLDDTAGWRHSDEWGGDFDRWLAQVRAEVERVVANAEQINQNAEQISDALAAAEQRAEAAEAALRRARLVLYQGGQNGEAVRRQLMDLIPYERALDGGQEEP